MGPGSGRTRDQRGGRKMTAGLRLGRALERRITREAWASGPGGDSGRSIAHSSVGRSGILEEEGGKAGLREHCGPEQRGGAGNWAGSESGAASSEWGPKMLPTMTRGWSPHPASADPGATTSAVASASHAARLVKTQVVRKGTLIKHQPDMNVEKRTVFPASSIDAVGSGDYFPSCLGGALSWKTFSRSSWSWKASETLVMNWQRLDQKTTSSARSVPNVSTSPRMSASSTSQGVRVSLRAKAKAVRSAGGKLDQSSLASLRLPVDHRQSGRIASLSDALRATLGGAFVPIGTGRPGDSNPHLARDTEASDQAVMT